MIRAELPHAPASIVTCRTPRNRALLQQTSPSGRSAQDEALDRLLAPAPLRAEPAAVSARASQGETSIAKLQALEGQTDAAATLAPKPPAASVAHGEAQVRLTKAQARDFALQQASAHAAPTQQAPARRSAAHAVKIAAVLAALTLALWFVARQLPQEQGIACLPNCAAHTFARADLSRLTLRAGNFTDANLQEVNLRNASLYQALFLRANLRDADLSGADLSMSILAYADLRGANLAGVNLRHADLRNADLRDANLAGADLRGATLEGATLLRAQLTAAVLTEANLDSTNLRRADLRTADLRRASLRFADLRRALIAGADFAGADLDDVILDDDQIITPLQTTAP